MIYIILTNKKHLGSDIWPKVVDQTKNIENIIRRVWATEIDYQQKTSKTHFITLSSSDKKTKYIN